MAELAIAIKRSGDSLVLSLSGEVDLSTSSQVNDTLRKAVEEHPRNILVDLRRVSFLDASALAVLARQHRLALSEGVHLVIVKGPAHVHRVFELTGLADVLTIADGVPGHD